MGPKPYPKPSEGYGLNSNRTTQARRGKSKKRHNRQQAKTKNPNLGLVQWIAISPFWGVFPPILAAFAYVWAMCHSEWNSLMHNLHGNGIKLILNCFSLICCLLMGGTDAYANSIQDQYDEYDSDGFSNRSAYVTTGVPPIDKSKFDSDGKVKTKAKFKRVLLCDSGANILVAMSDEGMLNVRHQPSVVSGVNGKMTHNRSGFLPTFRTNCGVEITVEDTKNAGIIDPG